jgi:hypothetical protein
MKKRKKEKRTYNKRISKIVVEIGKTHSRSLENLIYEE